MEIEQHLEAAAITAAKLNYVCNATYQLR